MDPGPETVAASAGAPAAGVAMTSDGEAGVGLPVEVSMPDTVYEYVVPGFRPASVQSGVAQMTESGLPPPIGVAVNV